MLSQRVPAWPRVSYKRIVDDEVTLMGLHRVDQGKALYTPYMQHSAAKWLSMLVLDCDNYDLNPIDLIIKNIIPSPTFITWNGKKVNHAHLVYVLKHPIARGPNAHPHPINYARAVLNGLKRASGSDPAYTNYLTKGPLCEGNFLEVISGRSYELAELAKGIDLKADNRRATATDLAQADGRNTALFHQLREELRGWTDRFDTAEQLRKHLEARAQDIQAQFEHHPKGKLPASEVKSTVKSVLNYGAKNKHTQPHRASKVAGGFDRSQVYSTDRPAPRAEVEIRALQAAGGQFGAAQQAAATRASIKAGVAQLQSQGSPVTATSLQIVTGLGKTAIYKHSDIWQ